MEPLGRHVQRRRMNEVMGILESCEVSRKQRGGVERFTPVGKLSAQLFRTDMDE